MTDDRDERDLYREHVRKICGVCDDGFALADALARFAAVAYEGEELREECRAALLRMIERRTDWFDE
ncbi:hypothetical protein BST12_06685 [Mycobacterium angelicum]|uniref:Uncharacterized protein n=2 Tax=Mycobacterium angelicum TaxID=470074 RepID=A0A1X0A152_MYCAN|nr:hypothetical protein BST12_06685 [Mycobacterium angelicum]